MSGREARPEGLNVTMDDVAATAGVSRATVSRVLAGVVPVSMKTRDKVLRTINQLGYVPNMMAQGLATRGSSLVGLMLRNPRRPAYGYLYGEIQDYARRDGLELIAAVPASTGGAAEEQQALHRLLGLRVRGLMVATGVSEASDLEPYLPVVPVVAVGRVESHPGIHGVSYDEVEHGALLADAVFRYGHRKVAVLTPTAEYSVAENTRSVTIRERLEQRGIQVHVVNASDPIAIYEGGAEMLRLAQHAGVTCAMFPTDVRAIDFMSMCDKAGLRIPEDVSVTGCDGIGVGLSRIGLATVRIPVSAVAARAVSVMVDLIEGVDLPVRHLRFAGEMIDGTSLGPPR